MTITRDQRQFADALAHYSQGLIYSLDPVDGPEKALGEYKKALELDPGYPIEHIVPQIAYCISVKDSADGMEALDALCRDYYREAIKKEPDNPYNYRTLAELLFKNGTNHEALRILKQGIQNTGDAIYLSEYCKELGKDFYLQKKFLLSADCFELLENRNEPQSGVFHFILAELYDLLNCKDKAIRHLNTAVMSEDPVPDAYIMLALMYHETEPEKAIETMQEGVKAFPENPKLFFFLGYIHGLEERYEDAIKIYGKLPDMIADCTNSVLTADYFLQYGSACEQAGKYDMAEKVLSEGIEKYPNSHQILNYLAYMWADKNTMLDKALDFVQRALEIDYRNGAYIDTLGWIYYRQEDYEEALKHILKANELEPNDPVINDHIGDVYDAMNNENKALDYWQKSFMLDPDNKLVEQKLKSRGINTGKLKKTKQ